MKKIIGLFIALSMLLSLSGVMAETQTIYLALGDSITAGYGLAEGEANFAELLAQNNGYTLINRAVSGSTTVDVIAQMKTPAVMAEAAQADVITITCGGNDLMYTLFRQVVALYNSAVPAEMAVAAADVPAIMSAAGDPRQQLLMLSAKNVLEGNAELGLQPFVEGETIKAALTNCMTNMGAIIQSLRTLNPDVTIIIATQYAPYKGFDGVYATLAAGMDAGAQALSKVIAEHAAILNYQVADVHTAFAMADVQLCNASMEPLNLDFHPNAAGHAVIAECFQVVLTPDEEPVH